MAAPARPRLPLWPHLRAQAPLIAQPQISSNSPLLIARSHSHPGFAAPVQQRPLSHAESAPPSPSAHADRQQSNGGRSHRQHHAWHPHRDASTQTHIFIGHALAAAGGTLAAHLTCIDDASDARMALWWDAVDAALFPQQPQQQNPPRPSSPPSSSHRILNRRCQTARPLISSIQWPSTKAAAAQIPTPPISTRSPFGLSARSVQSQSSTAALKANRDPISGLHTPTLSSADQNGTFSNKTASSYRSHPYPSITNAVEGWAATALDIEAHDAYIRGITILTNASKTTKTTKTNNPNSDILDLECIDASSRALALEWFETAAELGHADAAFRAGKLLENSTTLPINNDIPNLIRPQCTPRELARAITMYRISSQQGHAESSFHLALALLRKRSLVSSSHPQTTCESLLNESIDMLNLALKQGYPQSLSVARLIRLLSGDQVPCDDAPLVPSRETNVYEFTQLMRQHQSDTINNNNNHSETMHLLSVCESAAKSGSLLAAYNTALLYDQFLNDVDTAQIYYEQAIGSWIPRVRIDALYNLSVILSKKWRQDESGDHDGLVSRIRSLLGEASRLGDTDSSRLLASIQT